MRYDFLTCEYRREENGRIDMKLEVSQIRSITEGAAYITEENGYVRFHRFHKNEEALCTSQESLRVFLSTAGVVLRFRTNSRTLHLKGLAESATPVRSFFAVDIRKDGEMLASITNFDEAALEAVYSEKAYPLGAFEQCLKLGDGEKDLEIALPHSAAVLLSDVCLEDGSYAALPSPRREMLLAYGDSVTQGYDALHPFARYTTRLCDRLHMSELNKGIGGGCFDPMLAACAADIRPRVITVAYGSNDFRHAEIREPHIRARDFLKALDAAYPNVPKFVISPIWYSGLQSDAVLEAFARFEASLEREAQTVPNTHFVRGLELVPHDCSFYGDGHLHPSDSGFALYADNLYRTIQKYL